MKSRNFIIALLLFFPAIEPQPSLAAAPTAADAAFAGYVRTTEARLARQHSSPQEFLVAPVCPEMMSSGRACIERVAVNSLPDAILHHWRATQFVTGANLADLDRTLRRFDDYPVIFAPQVERTRGVPISPDKLRVGMRVRQRHIFSVVLDTDYEVSFGRLDPQRGYSVSRSTDIREVESAGTPHERLLAQSEEHGFLWRQNTYWSYEECGGGLYIQVESLSLTRSVPAGLAWAVGPYVESIPRDSMQFTLLRIDAALRQLRVSASSKIATSKGDR